MKINRITIARYVLMLPMLLTGKDLSAISFSKTNNVQEQQSNEERIARSVLWNSWDMIDLVKGLLIEMTSDPSDYSLEDIDEWDSMQSIFYDLGLGSIHVYELAVKLEGVFDTTFYVSEFEVRMNCSLVDFCDYLIRVLDD